MSKLPEEISEVINSARLKHFPKGQIILYQGDRPLDVLIIKSGIVKIYDIDENGNEKILHIVGAPSVIPFSFFSGEDAKPHWFYAALTDCELYVLPYDTLVEAAKANGRLSRSLTNNFSLNVHELLVRLSSLGKTKAPDKLIATLWFLVNWHSEEKKNGWWRVCFPVNHQLLADITGITRERAAMVMKEFQDNKIIRNPRLTVLEIHKESLEYNGHKHQKDGKF
jgi:CRP/FNR family cyclic AMP-dependent transcriptional regulator